MVIKQLAAPVSALCGLLGLIAAGSPEPAPPAQPPPATQPAPASVRVRIGRIEESRFDNVLMHNASMDNGINVYLQLAGLADFKTASAFGHWHIDQAIDDRGTDLDPMKEKDASEQGSTARDEAEKLASIDDSDSADFIPGKDGFCPEPLPLHLARSARDATVIHRLAGHFDLTLGGTNHTARFSNPTHLVGQTLADSDMKRVGVWIAFDFPDPSDGKPNPAMLTFHFHGDPALIHDDMLDVVDSDGKSVVTSSDYSGPTSESEHPHTYVLNRPLDDAMTITIHVRLDQRTIRIPFDLKDVPLP